MFYHSDVSTPRKRLAIIIRGEDFQDHSSDFVMTCGSTRDGPPPGDLGADDLKYSCRRVPLHLRDVHWTQLLSSPDVTDKLMLPDATCHVWKVLSKIESPNLIHCYKHDVVGSDSDDSKGFM